MPPAGRWAERAAARGMPDSIKGSAVLFSEATPPAGDEEAFNAWCDGSEAPDLVARIPGVLNAMRYRSEMGPHYLAVYELEGPDALDGKDARGGAPVPDEATARILERASGVTCYLGEERFATARGGDLAAALDAPVIYCAFLTVPMERCGAFDDWFDGEHAEALLACEDWLMARRFEVLEWEPERYTRMLLHYLADERALRSPELAAARQRERRRKLGAEPWFVPHRVTYRRHRARIFGTG